MAHCLCIPIQPNPNVWSMLGLKRCSVLFWPKSVRRAMPTRLGDLGAKSVSFTEADFVGSHVGSTRQLHHFWTAIPPYGSFLPGMTMALTPGSPGSGWVLELVAIESHGHDRPFTFVGLRSIACSGSSADKIIWMTWNVLTTCLKYYSKK